MTEKTEIFSKVLVREDDEATLSKIKAFCDDNNLIGMRDMSRDILEVVTGNIDLGAIFIGEGDRSTLDYIVEMARKVRQHRPEIPVFLRLKEGNDVPDLGITDEEFNNLFAGFYHLSNLTKLKELVDSFVFSMHYPPSMVRGIKDISEDALISAFHDSELVMGHPAIVRDKTIFGEILSLIELESSWCRGYMMLQVDKPGIIESIRTGRTGLKPEEAEVRGIDSMLSEITNLIWGGIKARFFSSSEQTNTLYRVQVPIVINHVDKYVTFGSDQPQLCIQYKLTDKANQNSIITIYQRFVFNMAWSPELFKESEIAMNQMINKGELELF